MSFLCVLNKHDYQPARAFKTKVVKNLNDPKPEVLKHIESWTGSQCIRCGKRKIKKNDYKEQSIGATQEAYDWLHQTSKRENLLKELQK